MIYLGLILLFILEALSINNIFEKPHRLGWIFVSILFYIGISEYVYIILYTMPIF